MKVLFNTAYYLFLAAVLAIGLLLIGSLVPIPGNIEVKIVQSGSMEPSIKVGSIVVVKPSDSYAVNDVITFGEDTREEIPTTHRIISERIEGGVALYTTKGDANSSVDPQEIREDEIIGKVLLDIPFLGFILDFARQPLGFVLIIGVPAALVIFDEAAKIWKEIRKIRRNPGRTDDSKESTSNGVEKETDVADNKRAQENNKTK